MLYDAKYTMQLIIYSLHPLQLVGQQRNGTFTAVVVRRSVCPSGSNMITGMQNDIVVLQAKLRKRERDKQTDRD